MHYAPESLEAFAQAAALGSFSAAARKLGKGQSTISEAIARLEIDLGLQLFDRSGRQPRLTEAGIALNTRAQDVLAAAERLQRAASQLSAGMEARLTLVLSDAYQSAQFEVQLEELDRRFRDLEFECVIAEYRDVIALISEGRATLGLLPAQQAYLPDLASARLAERADFGLFVALDHPLAQAPALRQADLDPWRALRLNTLRAPDAGDGPPRAHGRQWSAPNYLLLMEMAIHGFGWAELPRWLVGDYGNGRLAELRLPGWPRREAVDVIWSRHRPLGPAASWLLEQLQSEPLPSPAA